MYKESIFNLCLENSIGDLIVYNTASGNYVLISSQKKEKFINVLKRVQQNDFAEKQLINKGFLVREAVDEFTQQINDCDNSILFLTIIPTFECNFRCPYCFESHTNKCMDFETERRIIEFLHHYLKNYQRLFLMWYGGEPLLEIKRIESISKEIESICHLQKIPYVASITTNGYFLTWDNYIKLKKYGIRYFTITVDGLKKYHDKTRVLINGKSSFDLIIDNLNHIKEYDHSSLSKIIIRTNYTQESINGKEEWEKYLNNVFLGDPKFMYMPRYAWDNPQSVYSKEKFINFNFDDNFSAIDEIDVSELNNDCIQFNKNIIEDAKNKLITIKKSTICPAGKNNSMIIGPDGRIYKCQVCIDNEENCIGIIDSSSKMIINKNRLSIWESRDFKTKYNFCLICKLFPLCKGIGCSAKTMNTTNIAHSWCKKLQREIDICLMILLNSKEYSNINDEL